MRSLLIVKHVQFEYSTDREALT